MPSKTSPPSRYRFVVFTSTISILFSLASSEIFLRVFFEHTYGRPPVSAERSAEHKFWERSVGLGWSHIPNSSGHFTNGYFDGTVHMDAFGIRRNSRSGTFVSGYRNVFFLGDSTAASLEVDDDETVPALLERALRAQGLRLNVINLGVRGYGTDQAVRRALELSGSLPPTDIIYLYVENDVYNNNVLRQPGRKFGKGVYLKPKGGTTFFPYNYPVPQYEGDFVGLVILDGDCQPSVHTGSWRREPHRLSAARKWLDDLSYLVRALDRLQHALRDQRIEAVDPYEMVVFDHEIWSESFYYAYTDAGHTRKRCRGYFDSQMKFLMGLLREIPSLKQLHVIHFPDTVVAQEREAGRTAASVAAFKKLVEEGVLDSYVDLTESMRRERVDRNGLQCPYDCHFCEKGSAWLASHILDSLEFR